MGAVKDHHDQYMAGRQRELERVQLKLTASEERVRVLSEAIEEAEHAHNCGTRWHLGHGVWAECNCWKRQALEPTKGEGHE